MPFFGLAASTGVPDIPLITGGSRISNHLGMEAAKPKSQSPVFLRPVSRGPVTPARPVSPPPPYSPPAAAGPSSASDSSSRTAIPSPPSGPLHVKPQVLPASRLPVPVKRQAQSSSAAAPASRLSQFDERRLARENRIRPWTQGTKSVAKPPPACVQAPAVSDAHVTDKSMEDRRRARQERDRPWVKPGQLSASRPSTSTTVTAARKKPQAPVPRAQPVLRSILKSSGSNTARMPKTVAFSEVITFQDTPRWIDTSRHVYDSIRRR